MTKSIIKYTIALLMAFQPGILFAANTTTTTTTTTGGSKGVETSGNANNGSSVKQGADQTASANKGAAGQQAIAGAMMFAMSAAAAASQNYGTAAMLAGLGILSMLQSGQHGKAAGAAGMTSGQSNGYGDSPYDYDTDMKDPNNPVNKDPSVKALGSNIKKLQDAGIVDAKLGKITTPDGKSYKPSDFASQGAMAAAGFSSGAIAGAVATYEEIQKRASAKAEKLKLGAMTAASGFDEGGGGGGASLGESAGEESVAATGVVSTGAVSLERDPSSLAGMQKNYNGEPIGVAADSIFLMMTRRYKVKESQESFYTDAELALQK
ncbi:hypothetical protein [Bdellovibrio bacteriovorus]|uniref:hypothetical protein n=1 Tax=Bdellovibrio TaxID=958 RepID=UPI0035A8CDD1